jgi:hypothetical protein
MKWYEEMLMGWIPNLFEKAIKKAGLLNLSRGEYKAVVKVNAFDILEHPEFELHEVGRQLIKETPLETTGETPPDHLFTIEIESDKMPKRNADLLIFYTLLHYGYVYQRDYYHRKQRVGRGNVSIITSKKIKISNDLYQYGIIVRYKNYIIPWEEIYDM